MIPYSAEVDNAARLHEQKVPALMALIQAWRKAGAKTADDLSEQFADESEIKVALARRGSSLRAAIDYVTNNVQKSVKKPASKAPENSEE